MVSGILTYNIPFFSSSVFICDAKRPAKHPTAVRIHCSISSPDGPLTAEKLKDDGFMTGSAYDFGKATTSLTGKLLPSPKRVTIVRHGLSTWNEESRVQGSSNLSVLTETGIKQAERCRNALANIHFDQCFSSPISRAKSTAEIIWQEKEEPLVFLDSLKEAHLFYLEGMKNETGIKQAERCRNALANIHFDQCFSSPISRAKSTAEIIWQEKEEPLVFLDSLKEAHLFYLEGMKNETGIKQAERCRNALANIHFDQCFSSPISRAKSTAEIIWQEKEEPLVFLDSLKEAHLFYLEGMKNVDAKARYPKEYTTWREDAANFNVKGLYPVRRLWVTAREAWRDILLSPGENFLVITHKSILRAMICTALGLTPERFRAIDVNNGGICVFSFNKKGEAMIQSLNMTAHMYSDHVYRY